MRSGNPVLNDRAFAKASPGSAEGLMTIEGTVNKTMLLLTICVATAAWTWGRFFSTGTVESISGLMWAGVIGGLVFAVVTAFKAEWARWTAPAYAALEGLAIGGISATFEARYPGIVIQAVGLTFGTLLCLLVAYRSGLIPVTQNFRLGVVAATGGIALLYLVQIVIGMFGGSGMGFIHQGGMFGILFSLFVVTIAALNLVLDFDFIENGARAGAPKHMEWYGAFGLMVTLVWLYLEILRLLAKSRD
ncbi:MAG: Bax inhibitor-1/YccA family protein [Steroidobacteraceae bacterium]